MGMLPRVMARNATLKLASLGLAVFLWAVVRVEPADRQELTDVPVRVQVGDLDWTLSGAPEPAVVRVHFAGPVREVLRLDREGTSVRIPLDQVSSPDTVVQLRRDWVVLSGASGLIVEDVSPATVRLTLARNVSETRPVALRTEGSLPEGLALAEPVRLEPTSVQVRGGRDRVALIDSVPTRRLALSEVTASGTRSLELDLEALEAEGLAQVSLDPVAVRLTLVVDSLDEQFVPSLPIRLVDGSAAEFDVEPAVLVVGLAGARSVLSQVDVSGLGLEVSLSGLETLQPGEARRVPVQVVGVPELVRAEPVVSQVTVTRRGGRP